MIPITRRDAKDEKGYIQTPPDVPAESIQGRFKVDFKTSLNRILESTSESDAESTLNRLL